MQRTLPLSGFLKGAFCRAQFAMRLVETEHRIIPSKLLQLISFCHNDQIFHVWYICTYMEIIF